MTPKKETQFDFHSMIQIWATNLNKTNKTPKWSITKIL